MEKIPLNITETDILTLKERILRIWDRINDAAYQAGRSSSEVSLELAVKTRTIHTISSAALALKQLDLPLIFGHNHVQEITSTTPILRQTLPQFSMHLIGNLQTNKINAVLPHIDLLETLSSENLAKALSLRLKRDYPGRILRVFMEVNVSGENNKHGISPEQAYDLGQSLIENPLFHLEGLMTVGALTKDEKQVRKGFAELAKLRDKLQDSKLPGAESVTELSMGMSGDLEMAIKEGSTLIRVGTDIFGHR